MAKSHLKAVRQLWCVVCGIGGNTDPHHLRSLAYGRGMGRKSHDKYCVPLCRPCHEDVHMVGSKEEPKWFRDEGIEAEELALELWDNTPDAAAMKKVLLRYM